MSYSANGRRNSFAQSKDLKDESKWSDFEQVIIEHPDVMKSKVLEVRGGKSESAFVNYFIAQISIKQMELRKWIVARLPDGELPDVHVQLPFFPLGDDGEPDTSAFPMPQDVLFNGIALRKTNCATEEKIAQLWTRVLGYEVKSTLADFFEVGGNSLKAIRVLLLIQHEFGVEIDLKEFYTKSTVMHLSRMVKERSKKSLLLPVSESKLDYKRKDEQRDLSVLLNGERVGDARLNSLLFVWKDRVKNDGSSIALLFKNKSFSYLELDLLSNKFSNGLIGLFDVKVNDKVALILKPSEWMIIAVLGVLKTGTSFLFIDPETPAERVVTILEESACAAVVTDFSHYCIPLGAYAEKVVTVHDIADFSIEPPYVLLENVKVIYCVYRYFAEEGKKIVGVSQQTMLAGMKLINERLFRTEKKQLIVGSVPKFSDDFTIQINLSALLSGHAVRIYDEVDRIDSSNRQPLKIRDKVDVFICNSDYFTTRLQTAQSPYVGKFTKHVLVTGNPLRSESVSRFYLSERNKSTGVLYLFGIHDFCLLISCFYINKKTEISSPFAPFYKEENTGVIKLYSGANAVVKRCEVGKVVLTGHPSLPHNLIEFTNQEMGGKVKKVLLESGDFAYWNEFDQLCFAYRNDRQLQFNGKYLNLECYENELRKWQVLEEVRLFFCEEDGANQLVLYFKSSRRLDLLDIRMHFSGVIPVDLLPAQAIQVEHFSFDTFSESKKIIEESNPEHKLLSR